MLLALFPVAAVQAQDERPRTSPALLQLAQEHPDDTFHVIIQRRAKDRSANDDLKRRRGKQRKDLGLINGFAADLPGSELEALAHSPGVRWISLDAPMVSSAAPAQCSQTGGAAVAVTFVNSTSQPVVVNLLDANCNEITYATVASGASMSGTAYKKQVWRVRSTGGLLLKEVLVKDNTSVTLTSTNPCLSGVANASARGLVAAYSFDEGAGTTVTDAAGNSHTGTISGASWTTQGKYDGALSFDGISNIVNINDSNLLDLTTGMTLEAWVYPTSQLGGWRDIVFKGQNSNTGYGLYASDAQGFPAADVVAGPTYASASGTALLPLNTWSHLATTYDGSRLKLYVNGVLVKIQFLSGSLIKSGDPLQIGGNSLWGEYFAGRIDNLRIYRRALPVAELAANMLRPVKSAPVLCNVAMSAINADRVWNQDPGYRQGTGVGVAVVDSGISPVGDLKTANGASSRIVAVSNQTDEPTGDDNYGHGTHVAGIIAGNGNNSLGVATGVAPDVNLINVKVGDSQGKILMSDLIDGLQWIYNNKSIYNIRVVNISLNSTVAESYHVSALDAAVELLWFNGVTVVVAAGNNGTASGPSTLYAPANDPFVITVGAVDDMGSAGINDDTMTTFSAYGQTENGFAKPDLVAPGRNIISLLASVGETAYTAHSAHQVDGTLFRMSGTSMAAPMVSGAVALMLQAQPALTPDQVKARLMLSANKAWPRYDSVKAGAGYLDVFAAVNSTATQTANTGITVSALLSTGSDPLAGTSVNWNSVNWNSVNWNSVNWNSVNWNSVNWNSAVWDN
jgi:serine protease AprX